MNTEPETVDSRGAFVMAAVTGTIFALTGALLLAAAVVSDQEMLLPGIPSIAVTGLGTVLAALGLVGVIIGLAGALRRVAVR